jgi:hypothetical protein
MSYKCEYCENSFINKCHLTRHQKSETCLKIQKIIHSLKETYQNKINSLVEENSQLKQTVFSLEIKLNETTDKYEDLRKIVEKAATKTTVKNNYTHNNYLNYISSDPLRLSEIPEQLKQIVNCETIMYDDTEFHNHIVDNILKDENGKDKVLCTDINRKNFSYKDERSGELISDPELEKLREQLKKGADMKSVKRDLLNNLIKQCEETGGDPYKKFYDILQKLEFGTPFIEHVAKKTYIKTKGIQSVQDV